MVNLAKLKGKGAPPPADAVSDVIQSDQREEPVQMVAIQFRVPPSVFAEFSEAAGREFGFTKGAKSNLFLKMWAEYKKTR